MTPCCLSYFQEVFWRGGFIPVLIIIILLAGKVTSLYHFRFLLFSLESANPDYLKQACKHWFYGISIVARIHNHQPSIHYMPSIDTLLCNKCSLRLQWILGYAWNSVVQTCWQRFYSICKVQIQGAPTSSSLKNWECPPSCTRNGAGCLRAGNCTTSKNIVECSISNYKQTKM